MSKGKGIMAGYMKDGMTTYGGRTARTLRACACTALAGALLALGVAPIPALSPESAEAADNVYTTPPGGITALARDTEIEQLTDEYNQAFSACVKADLKTSVIQMRIDSLEAKIPSMQSQSDEALRELYKLHDERYGIVDMLLRSDTLDDFVTQVEYVDRIGRANLRTVNKMKDLRASLEAAHANLETAKAQADERMQAATEALSVAREARVKKQQEGVELAEKQAKALGGEGSVGIDGSGDPQPEDFRVAATTDTEALDDKADWTMSETQFIETWTPRIDAYLEGSALEGQGVNFARSAWRYCVDPRWSPAISNTESSKGAICIRPHNAWGWGAADSDPYGLASEWDSWEEAIDAHVKGLSKGYGYTITMKGAQSYCPSTWQSWYNKTLDEMGKI